MASQKKHALSVISKAQIGTECRFEQIQGFAIQQLILIRKMETEGALRALLSGASFLLIKPKLGHGKWEKWLAANVDAIGMRQVRYYMRLANTFLEKTKATHLELLAMPDDAANISAIQENDAGRRFMAKAAEFIGGNSLNELLVKYQIKGVAREGDEGSEDVATTVAEDGRLWFSDIASHLYGFRTSLLKPEAIVRMPPERLREILAEHDAQNSELHALCEKALGRN